MSGATRDPIKCGRVLKTCPVLTYTTVNAGTKRFPRVIEIPGIGNVPVSHRV